LIDRGGRVEKQELDRLFRLDGRVAIVTGGSRGIGRAIAEGFALAGAKVVIASRKADACAEVAEAIAKRGGEALAAPTHLGELAQLERLVAATVERFGGIDVLVNNAANALALPFGSVTPDAWEKSIGVNLRGPVFLAQYALPALTASGRGSIINVSSAGAYLFSANTHMYAAAKAALLSYTRSLAAELAARKIRVNAIAPGTIDTDMVRNNPPAVQRAMAEASFQRRAARPDEMVGPVLFLVSDAASFVTGQVLIADGGLVPR
jgi:NAD(P)-dependent dehydrogenase (short-subunit alcohol dehydrogenase family)